MALLEDRLETPSVVSISSLNFDTASDSLAREQTKALSAAKVAEPPSLLASLTGSNKSLLDEISGLFNSIMCNGLLPYDLRLDNLLAKLLKQLGLNLDLGLGCLANGLLLDQILGKKPFSFLKFGLGFGNLSLSKQALITALFGAEVGKLYTMLGYLKSSTNCTTVGMDGLLNGMMGYNGMGLSERLKMLSTLNSTFGNCTTKAYTSTSNNWTISKIANATTINNIIMLDKSVSEAYLAKLLGNVGTMPTYDRQALLSGLALSMANSTNTGVEDKLLLLSSIKNASTTTNNYLDSGTTLGVTDNVLSALNNSNTVSVNPTKDLNNILTGLDNLDPNWNIDPLTGDINYSTAANNNRIVMLAQKATTTAITSTIVDNQVVSAPLSTTQLISVLNVANKGIQDVASLVNTNGESVSTKSSLYSNGVSVSTKTNLYSNGVSVSTKTNLYSNVPLPLLYDSNNTIVSCCLKSLCSVA